MVEMGTIRKEGLPACLFCSAPTPSPRGSRRQSHRPTDEEKISWTDRGSHILHLQNVVSGDDAVHLVALTQHLRPALGLAANLMFEIAITKHLGRRHLVKQRRVWPRLNHCTPPVTTIVGMPSRAWSPLDLNKG
jgi:hypothetical protein